MSDQDRRPTNVDVTPVVPPATAGRNGILPFIVAGLLAVVVAVGYFAVGVPILTAPDEARAPESRIDATIQQQAPVAPAPARP